MDVQRNQKIVHVKKPKAKAKKCQIWQKCLENGKKLMEVKNETAFKKRIQEAIRRKTRSLIGKKAKLP